MSKINLDLKKFKHVKSDDKSTTLKHADGHQLVISHKNLGPEMKAQLSALAGISKDSQTPEQADAIKHKMAEGGGVSKHPTSDALKAVSKPVPQTVEEAVKTTYPTQEPKNTPAYAEGGKVAKYCMYCGGMAHGGECKTDASRKMYARGSGSGEPISESDSAPGATLEAPPSQLSQDVESVGNFFKSIPEKIANAAGSLPGMKLSQQPAPAVPPAPVPQPAPPASADDEESEAPASKGSAPQEVQVSSEDVAASKPEDGAEDNKAVPPAAKAAAPKAVVEKAVAAAPAPARPFEEQVAEHKDKISQEDGAFQKMLETQKIKPETMQTLFDKKDTLGKIGTLFGLLVGGFGAGLTHTENPIIEQMNNIIKNDLEAQKNNVSNAQNLYKLTQEHELQKAQVGLMGKQGELVQAQAKGASAEASTKIDALAQMRANRIALHALTSQVQNLPPGSPQRQAAEQQLALLSSSVNSENYNLADRAATASALMGYANGNNNAQDQEASFKNRTQMLRMSGRKDLADDMEAKHVAGVGEASAPVPDAVKQQIITHKNVNDLLNQSLQMSKQYGGKNALTLDLPERQKIKQQAETLQMNLIAAIKQAQHDGVYKPSEAEFLLSQIGGSPVSFLANFGSVPKVQEMQKIKQNEYNNLLNTYGIHGSPLPQTGSSDIVMGADGRSYQKTTRNGKTGYVLVK